MQRPPTKAPIAEGALSMAERTRRAKTDFLSAKRFKTIFDRAAGIAKVGVWACDLPEERLTWTPGIYAMFGIAMGTSLNRSQAIRHYYDDSLKELDALRSAAIRKFEPFEFAARITAADGTDRWLQISADTEAENGKASRIFGFKRDITHEKAQLDQWRSLAEQDPLTGLANRAKFQSLVCAKGSDQAAGFMGQNTIGGLILIDVDAFKQINDRYGHLAGDLCLTEVGNRLRQIFTDALLIARIGGDEFAVLLAEPNCRLDVEGRVRNLISLFETVVRSDRSLISCSVSIGVALSTSNTPAPVLYAEADKALYQAKAAGHGFYRIFDRDPTPSEHEENRSRSKVGFCRLAPA